MKRKHLGSLFGVTLLVVALAVLHHEIKIYHLRDLLAILHTFPSVRLVQALALTLLSYLIMTGYDFLALRYVGNPLGYAKTALASFIGYAFSNNIGLSMIAGASVRFRLYSAWGLDAIEITKVIAFCTATLWLGFLTLGGVVFLMQPPTVPAALHIPLASAQTLGILFLLPATAYFILGFFRIGPMRFKGIEIEMPPLKLILPQTIISICDWILAGAVLYVLLPPATISFPGFLGVFLLAQMAGLASQVPGGLGVFEAAIMLMLSPVFPTPTILGSLLVYRAVYYLLPLICAAALLGAQEVIHRREYLKAGVRVISQWMPLVVPNVLAVMTFLGGIILLFSGALPAAEPRIVWLRDTLPLPVIEISHLLGSIAGVGLLLIARGLQRRLDAAFLLTAGLLACGIVLSLLKGLDYEEAIAITVMLLVLLPSRPFFYRKASLMHEIFSWRWFIAAILVFCSSVWLIWFSYKHIEFSNNLWWRFSFDHDAPRSLRAGAGVFAVLFWFGLARLVRPARAHHPVARKDELERALPIIRESRETYANLALLGDKTLLFNAETSAFLMYRIEGHSWIVMGDPVGKAEAWPELIWQFMETCDEHAGWPVFYEVRAPNLPLYLDLGLTVLKLGEVARVPLPTFSLEGSSRKDLRYIHHRMEKQGVSFTVIPPAEVPALLPEMQAVSDAWLKGKNTSEKGFSLGFFQEEYLRRFTIGTVRKEGRLLAFANLWLGAEHEELSVDLMRHSDDAPAGIMDYLFLSLMLWGKEEGYRWFNLGMAPLSGLENKPFAPLWNKLGAFLYGHGEYFYNFQGIRQFKDKFLPEWRPRYLVSPGGLALPQILTNLTSLISGGIKGVVIRS